ncbi:MAG: hypothetical protein GQ583_02335 [Methyloprofundus sp.]|nr:hypothetical protein [Methyloprofundus sp.]
MAILIVVKGDKVAGADTHNVSGTGIPSATPPPPAVPITATADFDYKGSMTDDLSDFVSIDGNVVALTSSKSSLDPGEGSIGGHAAIAAKNITAVSPIVNPGSEVITKILDPIGTGTPSSSAGSTFVKVDANAVLLDGDSIDTCDGKSATENSSVTAQNQDFVSCSA